MKKEHIRPISVAAGIITVSTTRTKKTDASGKAIQAILAKADIPVRHYAVVPDQVEAIRYELYQSLRTCNCIIIDGGTGLTHDDCTIEAITPLIEKKIDGFGELFPDEKLRGDRDVFDALPGCRRYRSGETRYSASPDPPLP